MSTLSILYQNKNSYQYQRHTLNINGKILLQYLGALKWVQRMDWSGLEKYNDADRRVLREPGTGMPEMFVKGYDNFEFYWVLGAGHSVSDTPKL